MKLYGVYACIVLLVVAVAVLAFWPKDTHSMARLQTDKAMVVPVGQASTVTFGYFAPASSVKWDITHPDRFTIPGEQSDGALLSGIVEWRYIGDLKDTMFVVLHARKADGTIMYSQILLNTVGLGVQSFSYPVQILDDVAYYTIQVAHTSSTPQEMQMFRLSVLVNP